MGAYARETFVCSAKIGIFLGFILAVATVVAFGLDLLFAGFAAFILSWTGIALSLIAASLYIIGRRVVVR